MITRRFRIGIAGCIIAMASVGAHAQDAAKPSSPCSGFLCFFGSGASTPAPLASEPNQATAPVAAAAAEASVDGQGPEAKRAAVRSSPVPAVTIAADESDLPQMKALGSVVAGSRIKFVAPSAGDADFKVTKPLGETSRGIRLFSEQVHVVAGRDIRTMADLKGKVVSFGPADGATRAAAIRAFEALAMPVKDTSLDYDNAFDGLATGDVDAVVLLVPAGNDRLARLTMPGAHLVPWPDQAKLPEGGALGTIAATSYPRLIAAGDAIRVLSVEAVLSAGGKGKKESAAKRFLASLARQSPALAKRGFDLLKADLADRQGRRVASVDHR